MEENGVGSMARNGEKGKEVVKEMMEIRWRWRKERENEGEHMEREEHGGKRWII